MKLGWEEWRVGRANRVLSRLREGRSKGPKAQWRNDCSCPKGRRQRTVLTGQDRPGVSTTVRLHPREVLGSLNEGVRSEAAGWSLVERGHPREVGTGGLKPGLG